MPIRLYEYAKEKGLSSKELVLELQNAGFKVASHMSVLPEDAISYLENKTAAKVEKEKPAAPAVPPKPAVQAAPIPPVKVAPIPAPSAAPVVQKPVEKKFEPIKRPNTIFRPITSEKIHEAQEVAPVDIIVPLQQMTLTDFAAHVHKPIADVIFTLLKWKILSSKNQLLPLELVGKLADHYQVKVQRPESTRKEIGVQERAAQVGAERLPIVVVMGHVDHGKTTLLDLIRRTRVAAKEKGGITQHLGAYEAKTAHGSVVFLDTPGHEAFSKIRLRGAKVADIAVLVVAADDGVQPQTIEAIKQAKAMNTPIIVAINKIDRVDQQRIDMVRNELSQQHGLLPEEWAGTTIYVPISAKLGTNVDKLLEMIVLQAHVMELKADPQAPASGYVLESKVEKGLGVVATVIAQQGTICVGDYFICGATSGRVSVLIDSFGARIAQMGPSLPMQVVGFNEIPEAGDRFEVVSKESYAHKKKSYEQKISIPVQHRAVNVTDIKIIVKTDTISSEEAIVDGILKMSKKLEKGYAILHTGIGGVSESDVILAADTGARIVTLHVKAEPNAAQLAAQMGVNIQTFDIIYKLLEKLEEDSQKLRAVKLVRKKIGEAIVRKVFDIKDLGVIAGSYVRDGIFTRDGNVVIWRGTRKVGQGPISSLQRDRRAVKEVHSGYECAFMIQDFKEWEVDDRVECFADRPESS
jgi:translation initiation factor IF-2